MCCMTGKSSNGDVFVFAFDFDSDVILLGYLRYAEHTERLHRHHWKLKYSSLPTTDTINTTVVRGCVDKPSWPVFQAESVCVCVFIVPLESMTI